MLFQLFGPSVEIRTRGLLNPIQARYQTSPHPDILLRFRNRLSILSYEFKKCKCFFRFFKNIFYKFYENNACFFVLHVL